MRIIKLSKIYSILCQTDSMRNGFKHTATLFGGGIEYDTAKVFYINRTWERYPYQTVMLELIDKALKNKNISQKDHKKFYSTIKNKLLN